MPTAMLKRFVCPICGAFGAMPPTTPYVQCGSCATVTDFDLGVARRHPDWPSHQALQQQLMARHAAAVEAARTAGDRTTWVGIYAEMFRTLIESCPTVYPAQVQDAAYRESFVAFQSQHNGNLVFEASLVKLQDKVLDRAYDIVHDAEGYHAETLWPMFDVTLRYFDEQDRLAAASPQPADFAPQWLRRLGISLLAQEWLPRLTPAAQRELVERLGLARAYVVPAEGELSHCGGCGEALPSPPTDACGACKQPLDITRGAFACQTCGVSFHVVRGVERALCPYCAAELRESRMGFQAFDRSRQLFELLDSEVSVVRKLEDSPITGFDVLDGPVTRNDLPWRMVTVRATFAAAPSRVFLENAAAPDASSHREIDAWLELQGLPTRRLAYREHPRCTSVPTSIEEIERRLADIGATAAVAECYGANGIALEAEIGGDIVRIVLDEQGAQFELYQRVAAVICTKLVIAST